MLMVVKVLSLLSLLPYVISRYRTCIPNTHYVVNDRLCICDRTGRWNDLNCHKVERRQICQPGQIIWEECSQCICQDNGQLLCSSTGCDGYEVPSINREDFDTGPSCTPFKSYYINCTLCVCPASGRTRDARCAPDKSCTLKRPPSAKDLVAGTTLCIPNVMYLFPCVHCLCSDEGKFVPGNCVEVCYLTLSGPSRRCIPRSYYRKDCNVCRCPANSVPDDQFCTSDVCTNKSKFKSLHHLRNRSAICVPHEFTKPRCIYCDCGSDGKINVNACLELECLKTNNLPNDLTKTGCSPGEVFPICTECFCPRTGVTTSSYCTVGCSLRHKLSVLEAILKESLISHLIERKAVKTLTVNDKCHPNSLYVDQGKYCLCPDNGSTNFKICTSVTDTLTQTTINPRKAKEPKLTINSNMSCEANTFIEVDCNTCYCGKNGKIDAKWCTYDDCEAKRVVQERHKSPALSEPLLPLDVCTPGSISKNGCNICICPESGLLKDSVCTKNTCKDKHTLDKTNFACEPLTYYQVDCNICYCPKDGLKNVAKCTKHECEKNFLRSDFCITGELFSNDCNICVCPPSGQKVDTVCTNYTCSELDTPWKKIFTISQNLLGNHIADETARGLDLCFPGEEFEVGCNVCVCPDMGLREYAQCTTMLCDDKNNVNRHNKPLVRRSVEHEAKMLCLSYNMNCTSDQLPCTPGSMYIIRCRECICPYMGPLILFCRPLPKDYYCERSYPNSPYESVVGRRNSDKELVNANFPSNYMQPKSDQITVTHTHTTLTTFKCNAQGEVRSECYLCYCENGTLIEERCFKSEADNCTDVEPTFLDRENKVVLQ